MIKEKKIIISFIIFIVGIFCFATDKNEELNITASTSWTGAFAYLGGVDNIEVIAPGNMKHPPEYEITVSDVLKVSESDYFIYGGFERMMETLGNTIGNSQTVKMIKIQCDNSIDTVVKNAEIISKIAGTEEKSKERVSLYIKTIEEGRKALSEKGLEGASVLCHKHQIFLAKELGLEVVDVFGPGPVTSKQIVKAKNGSYDFIIDNVHNPVGKPLAEVAPNSKYIIWRNFPETLEQNSLVNVVKNNINLFF